MDFCPECGSQLLYVKDCVLCPCCGYSMCDCDGLKKGEEDVQPGNRARTGEKTVFAEDVLREPGNE